MARGLRDALLLQLEALHGLAAEEEDVARGEVRRAEVADPQVSDALHPERVPKHVGAAEERGPGLVEGIVALVAAGDELRWRRDAGPGGAMRAGIFWYQKRGGAA